MPSSDWDELETQIVRAWSNNHLDEAFRLIDLGLAHQDKHVRVEAVLYRSHIRAENGEWQAAKRDLLDAVHQMEVRSYRRYTTELSLGRVCEELGQEDEAIKWYEAALRTCVACDNISAGAALRAFMRLKPALTAADRRLIHDVCARSWQIFGLEGRPDVDDMAKTLQLIRDRESQS